MHTKKVFTSGRFGVRYGTRNRKAIAEIESIQKQDHDCPVCHYRTVRRLGCAIWLCKKCGAKFAGGAYKPKVGAVIPLDVIMTAKKSELAANNKDKE